MAATFTTWKNPLEAMIRTPGGVRVGDALRTAEANLELIREPCLADLDEQLDILDRLSAESRESLGEDVKLEMYQRANDIHAVAGVFGLADLSAAAFCLCELIDRSRNQAAWSTPAVEVHLSSLRLLRHPSAENRAGVVEGLRRLTEKIAPLGDAA
jgi:hypothetical protein